MTDCITLVRTTLTQPVKHLTGIQTKQANDIVIQLCLIRKKEREKGIINGIKIKINIKI